MSSFCSLNELAVRMVKVKDGAFLSIKYLQMFVHMIY